MTATAIILTAARNAATAPNGRPCRFTLRDVKREIAILTGTAAGNRYAVSEGGRRTTTGNQISAALRALPDEYTPVYRQSAASRRVVGFIPVTTKYTNIQFIE